MDEKSKKKKKLKQKQKQRQKQNQTVIVNVHSGKSTRSQGNPDKPRIQIPPPIHKVYASPIHDLVPQIFSKAGSQTTQQTLPQLLEKILQNQEQARQGNVLGSAPSENLASSQTSSSKKAVRALLRPSPQPDEQSLGYVPSDSEIEVPEPKVKGNRGRKKGSKNKPTPKVDAMEAPDPVEVYGVAEAISESAFSEKKEGVPDQLPDEFFREQWLLRPSQNVQNENRFQTLFDNPQSPEQPLNANTRNKKGTGKKGSGRKNKNKNLVIEEEETD